MGTRRLRDLHQRPNVTLGLYDERADRRAAAKARFGAVDFARIEDALAWRPDAVIVSTPPGTKGPYINLALDRGLHHFSEADMWTYGAAARAGRHPTLVCAPSATMSFLPIVRELRPLLRQHVGKLLGYQLFMSTYMPSWHPHEGQEYYARHRDTAPAREMIPFELHYLNEFFSPAIEVAGRYEKYGALSGDTEDTWSLSMRLRDGGIGQLSITMSCPFDYREGACFGTEGWAKWDIVSGRATIRSNHAATPVHYDFGAVGDVLEASYAAEINAFVDAVQGRSAWTHTYAAAQTACATLAAAETSSLRDCWVPVDPAVEPEMILPRRT
ncbi:MAG: Oxidoreductase-like protein [Verrucomicrobia bacterium]|nr:Oxidoreductase-like protein [Verrucomicrobiota bacterium]